MKLVETTPTQVKLSDGRSGVVLIIGVVMLVVSIFTFYTIIHGPINIVCVQGSCGTAAPTSTLLQRIFSSGTLAGILFFIIGIYALIYSIGSSGVIYTLDKSSGLSLTIDRQWLNGTTHTTHKADSVNYAVMSASNGQSVWFYLMDGSSIAWMFFVPNAGSAPGDGDQVIKFFDSYAQFGIPPMPAIFQYIIRVLIPVIGSKLAGRIGTGTSQP